MAVSGHPLARSFYSFAAGSLGGRALRFLVNVQLARALTPEYFGKVVLAQTVILFGLMVADFGCRTLSVRDIAAGVPEREAGWLGLVWGTLGLLAPTAIVLTITCALFLNEPTESLLILIFALEVPLGLGSPDWMLRGHRRYGHVGIGELIKAAVYFGLVLLLVGAPRDVMWAAVAEVAGWAVAMVYVLTVVGRFIGLPRIHLDSRFARKFVWEALPIGLTLVLTQIYMNAGIVFLRIYHGAGAVGLYGAVLKLTMLVSLLGALFGDTLLPSLSGKFARSAEEGRILIRVVLVIVAAGATTIAAVLAIPATQLLSLIYGHAYVAASLVLRVLAISLIPALCCIPFTALLIVTHHQRYLLAAAVIGFGTNVLLNMMLTPRLAQLGAALAELGTESSVLIALALFATGLRRLSPARRLDQRGSETAV